MCGSQECFRGPGMLGPKKAYSRNIAVRAGIIGPVTLRAASMLIRIVMPPIKTIRLLGCQPRRMMRLSYWFIQYPIQILTSALFPHTEDTIEDKPLL